MTTAQILMLAAEAMTYDAVVVLWVTRRGTQPVLMPRALGRRSACAGTAPARPRPRSRDQTLDVRRTGAFRQLTVSRWSTPAPRCSTDPREPR